MKKHLLAAAVATAIAAPAMAQNVTVYGIFDRAVGQFDTGAASAATYAGTTTSVLSSERIGFRGTEDLGAGLKAEFAYEGGLAGNSQANQTFGRAAYVGLSGAFGSVRIGVVDMQTTNLDDAVSQFGNFSANPTDEIAVATSSTTGYGTYTVDALGNDVSNGIVYKTPNMSGFAVEIGTSRSNSGAANAADLTGAVVSYEAGAVKAYFGRTEQDGAGVARMSLQTVAASYNLGVASVGVAQSQWDNSTSVDTKKKATTVSVKVPLGNGLAVGGYTAVYKDNVTTNGDGKAFGLILTKDLSKRTTGYAAYTSVDNEAGAQWTTRGNAGASAAGSDPNAFIVGVRHSF